MYTKSICSSQYEKKAQASFSFYKRQQVICVFWSNQKPQSWCSEIEVHGYTQVKNWPQSYKIK